jgi:hypothetical protein
MHTTLNLDTNDFSGLEEHRLASFIDMESVFLYDNTSAISRGTQQLDLHARLLLDQFNTAGYKAFEILLHDWRNEDRDWHEKHNKNKEQPSIFSHSKLHAEENLPSQVLAP